MLWHDVSRSDQSAAAPLAVWDAHGSDRMSVEPEDATLHQAGVIAYKVERGQIEILLITSRDTRRRIIPRGNIHRGSTPAKSAKREAFEEAGIKGTIVGPRPLGSYTYFKKLEPEQTRTAKVEVYLLRVTEQLKKWPEMTERRRFWLSIGEAIELVEEPGIPALLRRLKEIEHTVLCPELG
jgi:8-oxo-dGTP pyrophosphatase MutT (NUDIX family)